MAHNLLNPIYLSNLKKGKYYILDQYLSSTNYDITIYGYDYVKWEDERTSPYVRKIRDSKPHTVIGRFEYTTECLYSYVTTFSNIVYYYNSDINNIYFDRQHCIIDDEVNLTFYDDHTIENFVYIEEHNIIKKIKKENQQKLIKIGLTHSKIRPILCSILEFL